MNPGFVCRNHPDRPATGICVVCRASFCGDCVTKVQGINHCLACLSKRAKPRETAVRRETSAVAAPVLTAAAFGFFWGVFALLGHWLAER